MDGWLRLVVLTGVLLTVGLPAVHAQTDQDDVALEGYTPCNSTAVNGTIVLQPSLNVTICNITVKSNSTFTAIVFTRLQLAGSDTLTVFDGDQQVVNVTGTRDSLVVVVTSHRAVLQVNITANRSASVLQASYNTSGCTIQQTVQSTGVVQSPVYLPDKAAFACDYLLAQPGGATTKLALSFLQVALSNATLNVTAPSGPSISGTMIPADVYSSDPIQMTLSVPKVATPQNFSAVVSPISASSGCGQAVTVNATYNLKLAVPAAHAVPFDCRVVLTAAQGKSLWLNVSSLQLLGHGDSLEVIDGGALASGNVLAAFSSSSTSGYLVLSGQKQVVVRLVLGLMAGPRTVTADVKEMATVGRMYQQGSFSIPPAAGATSVTRYYLLQATPGATVNFSLAQQKANKTYDYNVSVYDGDQTSSPLLVNFSFARNLSTPVVSTGGVMLVVVVVSNTTAPLTATFASQPPGCDRMTSAPEGSFQLTTSPSVPALCRWTVTAPPHSEGTILLDVTTLQLSQKATLSVYSGAAGAGGSLVAQFNASSLSSAPLPSVAVSAAQWAQVVWSSGNSTNLTGVAVNVRFQLMDTLCGGKVQDSQGHLRSPGFPNLYPLNSLCQWTFPPSQPGRLLFFDFPQFQLAPNHSVVMTEMSNGTSRTVEALNGSAPLSDVLYASNASNTVTFSAQLPKSVAVSNRVAQGFLIQYWTLKCGGFLNQTNGTFTSPGYPAQIPVAPGNSTLCVWFVQLPNATKGQPNVVNMTLTIKQTGSLIPTDLVKVYDGDNLRKGLVAWNTSKGNTVNIMSRYNTIILVFNITAKSSRSARADQPKLAFSLNYTTYNCNRTCTNGNCMLPSWICNHKDDCGDDSDEQNCVGPPTPVHPDTQKGMKPAIVVLLFFVGLVLGILLTIIIPRIIRRFRTNRYHTFRDEPPVA